MPDFSQSFLKGNLHLDLAAVAATSGDAVKQSHIRRTSERKPGNGRGAGLV